MNVKSTGLIELAQDSDKQLWTWLRNLTFINRLIISCLAEQLAASNQWRSAMSITEERVHIKFSNFLTIDPETLICHLIRKHLAKSRLKNWPINLYIPNKFSHSVLHWQPPVVYCLSSDGKTLCFYGPQKFIISSTSVYCETNVKWLKCS
jgi:hypothetical protein